MVMVDPGLAMGRSAINDEMAVSIRGHDAHRFGHLWEFLWKIHLLRAPSDMTIGIVLEVPMESGSQRDTVVASNHNSAISVRFDFEYILRFLTFRIDDGKNVFEHKMVCMFRETSL